MNSKCVDSDHIPRLEEDNNNNNNNDDSDDDDEEEDYDQLDDLSDDSVHLSTPGQPSIIHLKTSSKTGSDQKMQTTTLWNGKGRKGTT